MGRLQVRETKCKTLVHRLELGESSEYTANFYRGCSHGCVYCYVPSLIHDERSWGSFVDVKTNAPEILRRELHRIERNVVFLCSATDPYQAIEARYRITRKCLEILLENEFPVSILTRSPLVLRDLDLLKKFEWVRVGFSISSVPNRLYEPGVPELEGRIKSLKRLSLEGITTWVSLAPIIPGIVLTDLNLLLKRLKDAGVSAVFPGRLRFKGYEESRVMFESATGVSFSCLEDDCTGTISRITEEVRRYDLEGKGLFSWKEEAPYARLEAFV